LRREPLSFSRSRISDALEADVTIQNILDRKGSEVLTIPPGATIKDAVDQMCKRGVAALIVRSGDRIIGIVSERDIVRAICRLGELALTAAVNEALAVTKITVGPDDNVATAMRLMAIHHLRHLPVVANQKLVGIVSIGDVVEHRVEDLEAEVNALRELSIARR
jgi:CBS domain-containing protein